MVCGIIHSILQLSLPFCQSSIQLITGRTHVKLRMYPDGGISRLRLYGLITPPMARAGDLVDVAAAVNGGLPIACSDMYFSDVKHLSMPGMCYIPLL